VETDETKVKKKKIVVKRKKIELPVVETPEINLVVADNEGDVFSGEDLIPNELN
jgi:hypothetical protein